jgi:hypothetical protein
MNSLTGLDKKHLLIICFCTLLTICSICFCVAIVIAINNRNAQEDTVVIPSTWDPNYQESLSDFEAQAKLDNTDWDILDLEDEEFLTVSISETTVGSSFSNTSSVKVNSRTLDDESIIMLSENDAWSYISNELFTEYPNGSFNDNKSILEKIQQANTETIVIRCWYWEDPSDDTNFNKITVLKTFAVNSSIAQLFEHAFNDIYNDPSQPVLNLADTGMGTWVLRGKNHNNSASLSAHSLGCCIDINPSTGSFKVNGTWYGNAYGHQTMSKEVWEQLPECHNKYHVLYDGCPIVEIFKSYGFVWGGDWSSTKDCMHLSFIGEGLNCRENGQSNYLSRRLIYE